MRLGELLKTMVRSFFVITTGTAASMYLYCLLFFPDASFSIREIGRIFLTAFVSDLPFFIFLSRRELGKKQMRVRIVIHFIVLSAILLYLAYLWNWITLSNFKEVAVFLLLVWAVYAVVSLTIRFRDKKLTHQINDRLKERYRSSS